jgi:hypothetical protein
MSDEESGSGRSNRGNAVPRLIEYVYWGAIVGLAGGLGTLFVVSVHYARAIGLSPAECAAVGCAVTLLLSHPVGLLGLAVGAACGAFCGVVAHTIRHRWRAS